MTNDLPLSLSHSSYVIDMIDEPHDAVRGLLIGDSVAMRQVRGMIRTVAPADAPVLIAGPTGSGKEVAARAIHAASRRSRGPFIAVNCGAIPAELIESQLFGHERGAFTGASERRIGLFEAAAGGTLLLDEMGDMPTAAQVRLLRVIEDRHFTRVGGTSALPFTGRIVAASHVDLRQAVDDGRFRADLWYRLAVAIITLPALADRREDVPALVTALSTSIDQPARLSEAALTLLAQHDWPGNVRELRSVLVRAALFHPPGLGPVDVRHVRALIDPATATANPAIAPPGAGDDPDLRALLGAVERRQLSDALLRAGGVVADAARQLGINRTTLVEKMRRHGLTRADAIRRSGDTACRSDEDLASNALNRKEVWPLPLWQAAPR